MIALFYSWIRMVYEALHGTVSVLNVFTKYGNMFDSLYHNEYFASLVAVMQTIGVTVCLVYFFLELADRMTEKMLSIEQLFLLFLRFCIAYLLIVNSIELMKGFMDFGTALAESLNENNIATSLYEDYGDEIKEGLEGIGNLEAIGYAVKLIFPWLIVMISNLVIYFIAISRSVELTIRTIFVPFAVANIYHDMQRSAGFSYMKKILALAIQMAVCLGICIATSAILQSLGGDPNELLEAIKAGKFDAGEFLDQFVLGGKNYLVLLGILFARAGLMIRSMQICNDIVGA